MTSSAVLVTGGAGYIGSHACKRLKAAGYVPVTCDSLVTGWQDAVKFGPFERGDIADRAFLDTVFARWQPVAVMHFAALNIVGDSVADPGLYWRSNVGGSLTLVEAAVAAGCLNFVFSSTCAVYGDQEGMLDEATPRRPVNPYGGTKSAIEDILNDFALAWGLRPMIFRYFNVAGADPEAEIGEFHRPETHLVPLMLDAIEDRRPALTICGTDYPTPDGTCIRDYVHVMDLVDAHVLGLEALLRGADPDVFCLGTGRGFSVREVASEAGRVAGRAVPVALAARRAGDAPRLVCGSHKASEKLGWQPGRSVLETMIRDAWGWHRSPGYSR